MKNIFFALTCSTIMCVSAFADSLDDKIKNIDSVIGLVGDVWVKDARYDGFHKELIGKFSDTPNLEAFKSDQTWVIVSASKSTTYTGIFKGRSKASMKLAVGDIVEMKVGEVKSPKSYQDLGYVVKIICKSDQSDYEDCAKDNPVSLLDKNGAKLQQPR